MMQYYKNLVDLYIRLFPTVLGFFEKNLLEIQRSPRTSSTLFLSLPQFSWQPLALELTYLI